MLGVVFFFGLGGSAHAQAVSGRDGGSLPDPETVADPGIAVLDTSITRGAATSAGSGAGSSQLAVTGASILALVVASGALIALGTAFVQANREHSVP